VATQGRELGWDLLVALVAHVVATGSGAMVLLLLAGVVTHAVQAGSHAYRHRHLHHQAGLAKVFRVRHGLQPPFVLVMLLSVLPLGLYMPQQCTCGTVRWRV
jgi:hypothetical protein